MNLYFPSLDKEGVGGVVINTIYNIGKFKDFRRNLRNNQTKEEHIIWQLLKKRQINNLRFHRQYGIGNYIADFYCPEIKLVIELDGGQHFEENNKLYDLKREEFMKSLNIKTLRFNNLEVLQQIDGVYGKINQYTSDLILLTPPTPSFAKRGNTVL